MKQVFAVRLTLLSVLIMLGLFTSSAYAIEICGNGMCGELVEKSVGPVRKIALPPDLCRYDVPWWPFWSGQDELPAAKLRVLANGDELANVDFCINDLWVKLGELRQDVAAKVAGQLNNINIDGPLGAHWTSVGGGLSKLPFETVLLSMEYKSGNVEMFLLTHDLNGFVHFLGTVPVTADFSMPTIFPDGVLKPLEGRIDDWVVEFPRADIDLNVKLPAHLAAPFIEGLVETVFDGVVENTAFARLREELQQLDPNNLVGSFLGPSAEILQAINDAADFLDIDLPSPPDGSRFMFFVKNPPANGSTGGEITIALTAPPKTPNINAPAYIVGEEDLIDFTVSAWDARGDRLEILASGLPNGATLSSTVGTGQVTATFSWNPVSYDDQYEIFFWARDEHGNHSTIVRTLIVFCDLRIECEDV